MKCTGDYKGYNHVLLPGPSPGPADLFITHDYFSHEHRVDGLMSVV